MTPLKGPTDAGNFRVKVGRYGERWYTDPLPTCEIAEQCDWHGPSVSTTKPPFANKYVTMKSVAEMSADEWNRLAALETDARYEAIKGHEKVASRVNMDRGTNVHARAESHLQGWPGAAAIIGSEKARHEAERFYPALDSFLADYQPTLVVAPEVVCLHRTLNGVGYGGTADAFVEINGETWVVDWKSRNSDHDAYLEEGAQGGAYLGAEYMIVAGADGAPTRAKVPEVSGVLIVSIREDGYRAFPIDRGEAVNAYHAMHAWWVAQRRYTDSGAKGKPWAPMAAATLPSDAAPPTAHTKDDVVARYTDMSAADQEAFRTKRVELSIDNDDVAGLWQLLDDIDHWKFVDPTPPAKPEPAATPTPPAPEPDEGGPIDDVDLKPLGDLYEAMDDEASDWFDDLLAQSRNGHSWEMRAGFNRTMRRYEIYRGLIRLTTWIGFDAATANDVTLMPLVWAASGHDDAVHFANVTPGAALATLDVNQAKTFSALVDDLLADRAMVVADPEGRWRLQAAA